MFKHPEVVEEALEGDQRARRVRDRRRVSHDSKKPPDCAACDVPRLIRCVEPPALPRVRERRLRAASADSRETQDAPAGRRSLLYQSGLYQRLPL